MTTIPKRRTTVQAPPDDDGPPPHILEQDAQEELARQAEAQAAGCWDVPDLGPQGTSPDPAAGTAPPQQSRHAPVSAMPTKPPVAPPPPETTPLTDRWSDAEKSLLGNIVARASDMPTRRAQHIEHLLAARDLLAGYGWASARNAAVFAAAIRIAESGTYPGTDAVIVELRRVGNAVAADFAGELAREFFSDAELLHWANQCLELSRACDLYRTADHIKAALNAGQSTTDVAPLLEGLQADAGSGTAASQAIISASDLVDTFPNLRPYIIDGLLRQGETMNLIAAPKIGKSWMLLAMLLCITAGLCWLGRQCQRRCVLLVDNELHPETLARRVNAVAAALGIDLASIADTFHILSLRGKSQNLATMDKFFRHIKPAQYAVIAIDALYRALPPDCEENSNEDMRDVYNRIDRFAESTGAAFVLVHHSTKGLQSDKGVTDVGSGAGAISRTVDVHCVIRAHEETDCAVMESRIRSGAQPEPLGLRWGYPIWVPDPDLDVERLAVKAHRATKKAGTVDAGAPNYMGVVAHAGPEPKGLGWFSAQTGLKDHAVKSLLRQAVAVGALHAWPGKKARDPERWATVPQGVI